MAIFTNKEQLKTWYFASSLLLLLKLLISIINYLFTKVNFLFIEKINIFSLIFLDDVVINNVLCLIYFGYMAYQYYSKTELAEEPLNASPHINSNTIQSKMNQSLEEEKKPEDNLNEESPNSNPENSQEPIVNPEPYVHDTNTNTTNVENNFYKVEYFKFLFCLQLGNILNRIYYQDLVVNYGGSLYSDLRKDDFGLNFINLFNIFVYVCFVVFEIAVRNRKRNPDVIKDSIVLLFCVILLTIICSLYTCFFDATIGKWNFLLYTFFHIIGVAVSYIVYDYLVNFFNGGSNYQFLRP